ncbi:hypothetical protein KUTeg_004108 [Tegillarca granosa]|uniref:Uncharacterized protein n=1 Tax=Tegillarca granosa TaxID=220873 RepID=A0ABQ9FSS1_TEGGR|nr:hypothetical protein KUTeg_004108 [Tegillarca granosa]
MPSESSAVPAQTEKPQHYMYLKEFRTQQCPLFLQHKCTQHRPFTCFHWHFMNQKRRRPVRKRDGTFNYSPDVYCTKYDETNGVCPDGDECPFLHRTAGDTERRYHLRYYKTGTCVYETDSKGHCVKNGPHCAFAHGAHDLRPPVYDIRELQSVEASEKSSNSSSATGTPSSLEKDKILAEDPKWNDTNYVLANYKTEQCKRPPRLCRQGYACPSYHNSRDRRRSPKKIKYRSTPCPNVKHGDDWGDPMQCESGDNCAYCHTRTEQQFHPEIYKSTKCNDMVQTGYCPRGPFCAFAHVEHRHEINGSCKLPDPIGKGRANSIPYTSSKLKQQLAAIDNDSSIDPSEKAKRKQNLILVHTLSAGMNSQTVSGIASFSTSNMSPLAPAFYPAGDTVGSVLGHALEDLSLDDIDINNIDKELDKDNDTNSLSSSLSAGIPSSGYGSSSVPIGIPSSAIQRGSVGSLSQSPPSPYGSFTHQLMSNVQHQDIIDKTVPFISHPNTSKYPNSVYSDINSMSPRSGPGGPHSPMFSSPGLNNSNHSSDVGRLKDEISCYKTKLEHWEQAYSQAKCACEAWKKEAEESSRKAKAAEEDKIQLIKQREETLNHAKQLKQELETLSSGSCVRFLQRVNELESLSVPQLRHIQQQLRLDSDRLEKLIVYQQNIKCVLCQEKNRTVSVMPCNHRVACENCISKVLECPSCHIQVQRPNIGGYRL